jgi:hypothetical protein
MAKTESHILITAVQKKPTVMSFMHHSSQQEKDAQQIESNPWKSQDFSVSDLWKSQQVDVTVDSDSGLSSVHSNADSSDDGVDIRESDAPNV